MAESIETWACKCVGGVVAGVSGGGCGEVLCHAVPVKVTEHREWPEINEWSLWKERVEAFGGDVNIAEREAERIYKEGGISFRAALEAAEEVERVRMHNARLTDEQRRFHGLGYDAGVAAAMRAVLARFPNMAEDLAVAIVERVAGLGRSNADRAKGSRP